MPEGEKMRVCSQVLVITNHSPSNRKTEEFMNEIYQHWNNPGYEMLLHNLLRPSFPETRTAYGIVRSRDHPRQADLHVDLTG